MTKTYPITDAQFAEAMNIIKQNGGTVDPEGSFEIMGAKGTFHRKAGSVTINITRKPLFATWGKIERVLDGFFG